MPRKETLPAWKVKCPVRFTAEPVVVWRVWDEVDQAYLPHEWGDDDLDHETAEERATRHAEAMESCRPT